MSSRFLQHVEMDVGEAAVYGRKVKGAGFTTLHAEQQTHSQHLSSASQMKI